jgi:uncharacterized repeat protein (TIGR03803 family)
MRFLDEARGELHYAAMRAGGGRREETVIRRRRPWRGLLLAAAFLLGCTSNAPRPLELSVLHAFIGGDGAWARGSLVRQGSTLYGRTAIGGKWNSGTVFRIETDGSGFCSLHSFTAGGDNRLGNQPHHNAMIATGSSLIGAALYGGTTKGEPKTAPVVSAGSVSPPPTDRSGNGTLFSLGTDGGSYAVLLEMEGGASSSRPHSSPLLAADGHTLYGLTSNGGETDGGTLYSVALDGSGYRRLHSFVAETGKEPHGMVAFDSSGRRLVGMTRLGGSPPGGRGAGVIFRFDLDTQHYQVLHTFQRGQAVNGATNGHGFLTRVQDRLYGTTELGGVHDRGVVFAVGEGGSKFTVLYSFAGGPADGERPFGSLTLIGDFLYGTTSQGGARGDGTLFRFRLSDGHYQMLASFDRRTTGAFPEDNLTASADGSVLFGQTQAGGVHDPTAAAYYGTVFAFPVPRPRAWQGARPR